MFNNNPRDSAALDRYITGDCWPWKRTEHVIARCANGHAWRTTEHHECGCVDLKEPECPTCGQGADHNKTVREDDDED